MLVLLLPSHRSEKRICRTDESKRMSRLIHWLKTHVGHRCAETSHLDTDTDDAESAKKYHQELEQRAIIVDRRIYALEQFAEQLRRRNRLKY